MTVKDAADRLLRLSGLSKPICHAAAREGDIFRSALCSQMAGKYLGWAPETDWQKGLERTYFYFEKEYRRERNAMPPVNGIPAAGLETDKTVTDNNNITDNRRKKNTDI